MKWIRMTALNWFHLFRFERLQICSNLFVRMAWHCRAYHLFESKKCHFQKHQHAFNLGPKMPSIGDDPTEKSVVKSHSNPLCQTRAKSEFAANYQQIILQHTAHNQSRIANNKHKMNLLENIVSTIYLNFSTIKKNISIWNERKHVNKPRTKSTRKRRSANLFTW